MRALASSLLLAALVVVTGCTSDTLESDTAYRRLVDGFSSEAECVENGDFNVCYQTLTLCANGKVTMDLVNRPVDGSYAIDGDAAVASFTDMTVIWELEGHFSKQLPGRHPWVLVEPLVYDCAD